MTSPEANPADLGELFHAAFRGLRRTWAEQLAPWDMSPHQWRALMTLLRRRPFGKAAMGAGAADCTVPGTESNAGAATGPCSGPGVGAMRLKDLAERLRIAPRSATEVVDQLEAKGLVRRDPDPTDRRATLVVATAAGRQLFADVSVERRDKSNEFFARLPAEDRTELARILARLSEDG